VLLFVLKGFKLSKRLTQQSSMPQQKLQSIAKGHCVVLRMRVVLCEL
jgi:hypothetical protein